MGITLVPGTDGSSKAVRCLHAQRFPPNDSSQLQFLGEKEFYTVQCYTAHS